jgi:FtsP/CotA-like multicopper oxidase with cupredoxin domain
MHWHGFLQTGTNQMDGVPGVTQCPIAPNATMTYTFRAELYGTAWYHTHYSSQYSSGASGPIVIYGPTGKNPDIDLGPVMLFDWYRNDYLTNVKGLMRPVSEGGPINPLTNSNLINGKMRFPCSKTNLPCETASYSTFQFTSGKNHLLRLVNTGSNAVQKFAIDGLLCDQCARDSKPDRQVVGSCGERSSCAELQVLGGFHEDKQGTVIGHRFRHVRVCCFFSTFALDDGKYVNFADTVFCCSMIIFTYS